MAELNNVYPRRTPNFRGPVGEYWLQSHAVNGVDPDVTDQYISKESLVLDKVDWIVGATVETASGTALTTDRSILGVRLNAQASTDPAGTSNGDVAIHADHGLSQVASRVNLLVLARK